MEARDVMRAPVITIQENATIKDAAKLLVEHRISGLPVVDPKGKLVGVISEGDLVRRQEIDTQPTRSWWLELLSADKALAADYIKTHSKKVADVMSRNVITASPNSSVQEIATTMEKNGIKRVPIVREGNLIGIVTRANLVQMIGSSGSKLEISPSDSRIREKLLSELRMQQWAQADLLNVTVHDGVVDLWGVADSETERKALRVAAEAVPGVRAVNDQILVRPLSAEV